MIRLYDRLPSADFKRRNKKLHVQHYRRWSTMSIIGKFTDEKRKVFVIEQGGGDQWIYRVLTGQRVALFLFFFLFF